MDIKIGQWYKCLSVKDRAVFINKAMNIIAPNTISNEEITTFLKAELLKIVETANKGFAIRYRSTYNSLYLSNTQTELFKADDTEITIINSMYGTFANKGEIKMNKYEELGKLIDKYKDAKLSEVSKELDLARRQIILKSDAAKTLTDFAKLVASRIAETPDDIIYKMLNGYISCMNEKDINALCNLAAEYDAKRAAIKDKVQEITILIQATDTFEQTYKLLIEYGVINKEDSSNV